MARGGGAEAVEGIHHAMDGRIETEGPGGRGEIVVDGLRDPDDRQAVFKKLLGGRESIVAADTDEGLQAKIEKSLFRLVDDPLGNPPFFTRNGRGNKMALAGRAQDRAAGGGDSLGIFQGEGPVVLGEQKALVTANETDYLPPEGMGRHHRRTNDRVRSGTIRAAGQNSNAKRMHDYNG